jgi:hypothetical protein
MGLTGNLIIDLVILLLCIVGVYWSGKRRNWVLFPICVALILVVLGVFEFSC